MIRKKRFLSSGSIAGRRDFLRVSSLSAAGLGFSRYLCGNAGDPTGEGTSVNIEAQDVVNLEQMWPRGKWQEGAVPDTLDLAKHAELSINVLTGNLEPAKFYSVYQGFSLRPDGPRLGGITWNINPKNARALPWMRTMCGSEQNLKVEYNLMRALVGQIADDGQVYVPVDTDSVPRNTSNPFINGRLAMAIANWYERDKNPAWLNLVQQISLGLQRIAIQVEDRAYYPLECGYKADGTWHYELRQGRMLIPYKPPDEPIYDQQGVEGSVKDYGAIPMRALHWCYKLKGDKPSLEMARRLSRYLLKPTMWADTSDRGYLGHEHGIFEGHFHGNIGPLFTLLELAVLENDAWLKGLVKEGYEHGRRNGVTRMGWFPAWTYPPPNSLWKQRKPENHNNRTELCAVSDMLLLAVKLSDAGLGDYWDDVDHIVRNKLIAQQFTSLDLMRDCAGGDTKHDAVIRRFVGGFGSAHPTYNSPAVHGCCTANGSIGLYYAWHGITRFSAGVATVNLFMNRVSSWMDVASYLPYEGKVVLHNKQARTALVRIPYWLESGKLKAQVNRRPVELSRSGAFLIFENLKKEDEISLEFPMPDFQEKHTIAGTQYTLLLRGSTLVEISPRGNTPGTYPIYQRDSLKLKTAPMITRRRFVSDQVLPLQ